MAIVLSVLPFTLLYDGICIVCPSIYPPFWPSERRVNGRTDNTMAIRKEGKWKNRQYFDLPFFLMAIVLSVLPFTLLSDGRCIVCRVNGRTDNTMAIRKKGKWKDRQYNGHQKGG
jgi:hypothetical protein